jgi:hypothetical protein
MTTALTAVTMLLIVQAGAPSPEAPRAGNSTEAAQTVTITGEKAFRNLFTADSHDRSRAELAGALVVMARRAGEGRPPERKVVCGMVVMQADPSVDPKFVKEVPGDPASMKIRRIPAPACTD